MELWIRSQNKKRLLKIDDIGIVEYNGYYYVVGYKNGNEIKLGKYGFDTATRALEVLDEIQIILQPAIKALTPLTESKEDYKNHCMKTELVGYETTYDIFALPTYVYEMPSE